MLFSASLGTAAEARGEQAAATNVADTAEPLRALQSLADDYAGSGKLPGIVIAFGRGDAPPSFASAGRASDDPDAPKAGPDTLWRIYSMTKPITALAAMMLVEEGRLSLDQPIGRHLPAFRSMRVLTDPDTSLESRPAQSPITVRHLLTHSAGLTYQFLGKGPLRHEYERLGLLGGRADPEASKRQPSTLAEFADRVAGLPLLAEPGTSWNYSVSTDVLGRLIEAAAGMPLERFVQTRLLDPLGMNSTYWTVPTSETGRLATSYAWVDGRWQPLDGGPKSEWLQPPKVYYGGSGLVSSARDYDRFLQMLAGCGRVGQVRVLRCGTVKLALSNLLPPGVKVVSSGTPDMPVAEGFGAGGWVYLADVPQGVRAGTYGWFGVAGTSAIIDPASGVRLTIMANYYLKNNWPLQQDAVKTVYAHMNRGAQINSNNQDR
jgi:CubicO group peptidase (beta-lactamase class C family)